MPLSTADIGIELLMSEPATDRRSRSGPGIDPRLDRPAQPAVEGGGDVTNSLAEIHDRMTARAFMAVHNPEQGPEVRRVLEELLAVLDRTSPDGVI